MIHRPTATPDQAAQPLDTVEPASRLLASMNRIATRLSPVVLAAFLQSGCLPAGTVKIGDPQDTGPRELPTVVDTDGDGISDDEEAESDCLDPDNADTDGDGLNDGTEVNGFETDPCDEDSDDDGLNDHDEAARRTDPNNADTDGDGFPDGEEVDADTDPLNADDYPLDPDEIDSDEDGLSDAEEEALGTDPYNADTDGDGLNDKFEADYGFDPVGTNESLGDPDGDGLITLMEQYYGTNPLALDATVHKDPDGDGTFDVPSGFGENLTLNQPVESFVEGDPAYAHPPENLVDGNVDTQAYPASADGLDYVVTLDGPSSVRDVELELGVYGTSDYVDHITQWALSATLTDGTEVVLATEIEIPESERILVALTYDATHLPIETLRFAAQGTGWLGAHELNGYEQPEF